MTDIPQIAKKLEEKIAFAIRTAQVHLKEGAVSGLRDEKDMKEFVDSCASNLSGTIKSVAKAAPDKQLKIVKEITSIAALYTKNLLKIKSSHASHLAKEYLEPILDGIQDVTGKIVKAGKADTKSIEKLELLGKDWSKKKNGAVQAAADLEKEDIQRGKEYVSDLKNDLKLLQKSSHAKVLEILKKFDSVPEEKRGALAKSIASNVNAMMSDLGTFDTSHTGMSLMRSECEQLDEWSKILASKFRDVLGTDSV